MSSAPHPNIPADEYSNPSVFVDPTNKHQSSSVPNALQNHPVSITDVHISASAPVSPIMPHRPQSSSPYDVAGSHSRTPPQQTYEEGSVPIGRELTEERQFGTSGFLVQLTATIHRQLIQKRRMWVSCLLEFLLPILFVIGLLAISLVSTRKDIPPKQYISTGGPWELGKEIRGKLCARDATANADLLSLLERCDTLTDAPPDLQCLPVSDQLPVDGLCLRNGFADVFAFAMEMVETERDVEIPNYDDYILFKWMACAVIPTSDKLFSDNIERGRQSGKLYVTPDTSAGTNFANYMNTQFVLFKHSFGGQYPSRDAVIPFATSVDHEGEVWAIVSINTDDANGIAYTLSMNTTAQELLQNGVRDKFIFGLGEKQYAKYTASGALTLQKAVNDYYLFSIGNPSENNGDSDIYRNQESSHLVIAPMPIDAYTEDGFLRIGGAMGPLLLVLAFLYPVSQLSKRLVEEKEQRLREGTMIMGLSKAAFFTSWLLVYYVQMFFISIIIAIILKVGIAKQSDFFVIWVAYLFFSLTTVNLAALLSTLFSKAKIAALCVPLLYFVFAIPAFALPDTTGPGAFYALSFLCPVPFSVALKLIFNYEINNGLGWNAAGTTTDEPYNYGTALAWFILDFFLYIGLMLYFDLVIPKDWGTTLHPCFCCCLCCQKKRGIEDDDGSSDNKDGIDNPRNHLKDVTDFNVLQDYPSPNGESSVHIRKLRKEFPGANGRTNVAVDGMELRLFPDSITVFLGHNGAGKTTVMNMMTGMMSPSSGDVTIYGNSILSNMQAIRRDIGFCPQHNILWDDLTCMEHLQYFARLKGMKGSDVDEEALEMLGKVDLLDKRDVFSCNLSGGQKRKLSVAIAFMGRARLVLLDEPTAGMDVAARRHTWDVLKEMSKGRTILLTTHFMDEADLLGSRIAIMSKGALHSYGTPMYLKNNLGSGYVMRIASPVMIADPNVILREVQKVLPKATIREAKGQELAIALPKDDTRLFPQAIRSMDSADVKKQLNISSVSVSVASLEDVFLAIAHQEDLNGKTEEEFAAQDEDEAKKAFEALERVYVKLQKQQTMPADSVAIEMQDRNGQSSQALSMGNSGGFTRQLKGMLMKRFNHGRRDYCALCLQILAPILCIIVAMAMGEIPLPKPEQTWYDNGVYDDVDQVVTLNNCPDVAGFFDSDFSRAVSTTEATTSDFSSYLLRTFDDQGDSERMVAFSCNDSNTNNVMLVNATSHLSAAQAVTQLYRAKTKAYTNGVRSLSASQWPLPFSERKQSQIDTLKATLVALFVLIPFTFIPSTFVAYVVRERECKSKHLQFVSGASYTAYWLGNFLFDLASYTITVLIAFIIFAIFDQEWAVGSADAGGGTFVLFMLYGLSAIGFAYLVSFLFDNHSTAQTVIMMVNFLIGFLLVLLMFFLRSIDSTKDAGDVIVYFLRVAPPFALGDGLFALVMSNAMVAISGKKSSFSLDVAGYHMLYMGILSVVFLAITMFIDHPSRAKRRAMMSFSDKDKAPLVGAEDEDVARERSEVETGRRPTDVVQVQGLRKEFDLGGGKQKVAVQNITFGVKPGEVFGFLGTNGAGKTTTMSMLTTEILPTCGNGRIGGFDIVQESDKTRRLIGYCPQFDAIMDLLTPAEHLRLFSSLRGIPSEDTDEVIEALINSCALQKYRDIPAGRLSGGNKRKLSVAMALIGGPSIVFLDEPSAGMDPHARRLLWDVIIFVAKHSSVVLTTHHLEEVDVLAHRVGIMDAGLMKCLGSLEHLKVKFGSGFELTIQVSETGFKSATDFIASRYPAAVQVEARQQRILYTLPFESTDLASLFETIQRATDDASIGIVDYTVQQTSLEQVFLRISEHTDEHDAPH